MSAARPITLLIAAMGGEGGGVLTDWIIQAAEARGHLVQATSIPGVAQRTGATTYYVEIMPIGEDGVAPPAPVMSLYPSPGMVDIMVASELVEAGRALQMGYVSERTLLVASTHRVYSMAERTAMGDQRYQSERIMQAAETIAGRAVLFDMEAVAREAGSVINSVLLGAIAGSGRLPIPVEGFEDAIRADGKAVEANLRAFQAGLEQGQSGANALPAPDAAQKRALLAPAEGATGLLRRIDENFPEGAREILREGVNRLVDYQDAGYAALYVERLDGLWAAEQAAGGDGSLLREAGRHLALWMAYEDIVRVAQAKTRPERFARIRKEVGAAADQPLRIVEYFKPGVEEAAALLPQRLGEKLTATAERRGWTDRLNVGLHIPSTSLWGYALLRSLAGMKRWRRNGLRYRQEQAEIELWLERIRTALPLGGGLAMEIVECARILKGYGDTYRRGRRNFAGIMQTLVVPALAGEMALAPTVAAIRGARGAALADQDGKALAAALQPESGVKEAAE